MVNISRISRNLFWCSKIPIRLTQPSLKNYTDLRVLKFIKKHFFYCQDIIDNITTTQNKRSRRSVVEKQLVLYPGVPNLIPDSSSLLDETLNPGTVSIYLIC